MASVFDASDSRAATNALLAGLREDGVSPATVALFLARAARRSLVQAARHPRALAELTVLHGALCALGTGNGRAVDGWPPAGP
ncbi:hypothetical protein ACFW2Y_14955 [Streptomyces sp. NPDC058877]|uniref:hypothetical protein n=1 Tax=unclassified Streptomyces TaxID=2593676 RepID=UPI00369C4E60